MDKLVILSLLLVGVVMIEARGLRSRTRKPKHGPAGPIDEFTVDICYEEGVKYTADTKNLCWFWECVESFADGGLRIQLLPRRCALGSRMPWGYKTGLSNPCSVNFDSHVNFECTRTEDQIVVNEPACFKDTVCYNNGTAKFEGPMCWCDCLPEWQGNFDCTLPTQEVELNETAASNTSECYYKGDPPCDLAHGCENNGICHNTCGDFWCDCPVPYTNGKRCEGFSCDTNPCKNGGTCNRGEDGISEVSTCICPAGFYGLLCEYGSAAPARTQPAAADPAPAADPNPATDPIPATAPAPVDTQTDKPAGDLVSPP